MAEIIPIQPKTYNPLHDVKDISKLLDEYKSCFEEKAQLQSQIESVQDIDALYGTVVKHLNQFSPKDENGKVKSERYGYHDHPDKKRLIEDLIANIAMHGIKKTYGDDAVKTYSKKENHELLRQYVQTQMLGNEMSYDQFMEELAEEKNLRAAFHDSDSVFRKILDRYSGSINKNTRRAASLNEHLSKDEHYNTVIGYANKMIAGQKHRFKPGVESKNALSVIAELARTPDRKVTTFKPHKKWFDQIKDDAKKAA